MQDRHRGLTMSDDGRDLAILSGVCILTRLFANYHSPSRALGHRLEVGDSAVARADDSIPPECGIYYYEVEILEKGDKG